MGNATISDWGLIMDGSSTVARAAARKCSNAVNVVGEVTLGEDECESLWKQFREAYAAGELGKQGVKLPKYGTCKAYQLIALYGNMGAPVHKDAISSFVAEHMRDSGRKVSGDQQVRHLQANGYNVYTRGSIMDNGESLPASCYMLADMNVSRNYNSRKRETRLDDAAWDKLKSEYDYKCAQCGRLEGSQDDRTAGSVVMLQQGHIDPGKPLTMDNTIPQCSVCNQSARDRFVFNKNGAVELVNDGAWLSTHMTANCKRDLLRILAKHQQ